MKAAYGDPHLRFWLGDWPLETEVIITAAKEEVRRSSTKTDKSACGGGLGWMVWTVHVQRETKSQRMSYFN